MLGAGVLGMSRDLQAENKVRDFYNTQGWGQTRDGVSVDAALWEDLRPAASQYVRACRRRILAHLPSGGERLLDAASGPIQYPEYLEYSRGFRKRFCVDISEAALAQAKKKLGERGEFVRASILELPFGDDYFDAAISLHTLYHIDREQQAQAVRQLIRVTRRGAPLIIIYTNPDRLFTSLKRLFIREKVREPKSEDPLYYFAHPLSWWRQFEDECEMKILPWRSLTAQDSRRMIPPGFPGRILLRMIYLLEDICPGLATRWGAYPMIILIRRE